MKSKQNSSRKKYKFNPVKENYEDYSSGRVLYGAPKATNFPVRLASEIFLCCSEHLKKNGSSGPYTIYDPFCGSAYSLTVMGFFHGLKIKDIFASDVNNTILEFAQKNLSLLSEIGLQKRINELEGFIEEYGKVSHKEALESAHKLEKKIKSTNHIKINCFGFDILSNENLPKQVPTIDFVITDLPYGKLTNWVGLTQDVNPTQKFLNKIKTRLAKVSIVAIVLNKKQEIKYDGFVKIKTLKLEKRKIILLEPLWVG
ncbi:hypothetical protein IPF86_01355 [Candidatus Nomurabacteria bacterium]|jgi:hypothetical protein|nr:MAG: hypothetical protein IPF86_01355 [Candidatus Nomurabacteria bacterium]